MRRLSLVCAVLLMAAGPAMAQSPVPFVNQPLVPDVAQPGGGAFTLTVSGGGFVSGAAVEWNGTPLTTQFDSDTTLKASIPAANIAAPGTAAVTVKNPGTAVPSNTVYFPIGSPSKAVYYNNASGSPLRPPGGIAPMGMGDFNNDGKPDIVGMACYNSQGTSASCIQVLLGNGDGLSAGPQTPMPAGFAFLTVGDFNGDGKLDVLAYNGQTGTAMVLLGNGDGTFIPGPSSPLGVTGPPNPPFGLPLLFVKDFNGDGKLDFLAEETPNYVDSGMVQVFLGNGDGTFTPGPKTQLPSGFGLLGIGDFNGDGKLDLVVKGGQALSVMLGNGDGTFSAAPGTPVTVGDFASDAAVADFNGDGIQDIAVPNSSGAGLSPVFILLGNGDGTFNMVPNCCGPSQQNQHTVGFWVVPGDFNDDGKVDLALDIQNLQSLTNPEPSYMEVFLSNGDGTFTPMDWTMLATGTAAITWLGDMNDDGKLDFMTWDEPVELSALLQGPLSGPTPDFTIAAASPSVTIKAGDTATDDINITDVNGFLAPTSPIICSGLPPQSSCTPPSLPGMIIPTAKASLPMQIATQPPAATSEASPPSPHREQPLLWWGAAAAGLIFLAVLMFTRGRAAHPRAVAFLSLAALLVCAVFAASCGKQNRQPPSYTGTPPGTYAVTVTETMGSITHSTGIQLTVQQ